MTAEERPNVILVMADQMSAFVTSPYGNRDVRTPNLQALADGGVLFERCYCNNPLCAPSRASMMTGRLAGSLPVNDNAEELPASVPTFAHVLRGSGYLTVLCGKMHFVGPDQLHGFEERLTTDIYPADYRWTRSWQDPGLNLGGRTEQSNPSSEVVGRQMAQMVKESGPVSWSYQLSYDEMVHSRALERLRGLARRRGPDAGRPWFLCVSYTQPHDPYVCTQDYWDRYEHIDLAMPERPPDGYRPHQADRWVDSFHGLNVVDPTGEDVYRSRRGYYSMVSYIDDKLGELVAELERLGEGSRTIIIFTSDHGDQLGEHGMWFKRTYREWSSRVPLVVAGTGVRTGHRVEPAVSLVDLFPTLASLTGGSPQSWLAEELDGGTLEPFLRGEDPVDGRRGVVIENYGEGTIRPIRALVRGHFKFVYVHGERDQLFDLDEDPNEWCDLSEDPRLADVRQRMKAELLDAWDPEEEERRVVASQRKRAFLRATLDAGAYTSWDYNPPSDASRQWVRKTDRNWDPDLGC